MDTTHVKPSILIPVQEDKDYRPEMPALVVKTLESVFEHTAYKDDWYKRDYATSSFWLFARAWINDSIGSSAVSACFLGSSEPQQEKRARWQDDPETALMDIDLIRSVMRIIPNFVAAKLTLDWLMAQQEVKREITKDPIARVLGAPEPDAVTAALALVPDISQEKHEAGKAKRAAASQERIPTTAEIERGDTDNKDTDYEQ